MAVPAAAAPVTGGAVRTSPTLAATIGAFVAGNLFGNFLLFGAVFVFFWGELGLSLQTLAAVVVGYYIHCLSSNAHISGWQLTRGGRNVVGSWLTSWMAYFDPIVLIDGGLAEGNQYVFAYAPHGIHGFGTAVLMDEGEGSPFFRAFPWLRGRLVGLGAKILFFVPLVREVFLAIGWRDASRACAVRALSEGNSVYIIVGGEAEALLSRPGTDMAVVAGRRRRGFVKLALDSNAELVPMYCFRNTDTYSTSSAFYGLRRWLSKRFQVCLPIWWGRWGTPLPHNVQLTVAIGKPVPMPAPVAPAAAAAGAEQDGAAAALAAAEARLDTYHAAYIAALQELFERHKAAAGYPPERKLIICESL